MTRNAIKSRRGKAAAAKLAVAEVDAIRDAELVEQRRTQILDAAQQLFLDKGFSRTTIRDICAASGVNQASLYDYVANKDDILRRVFNRMFTSPEGAAITAKRKADAYPSIEAYLEDLLGHSWTNNRQAILLTYQVIRDLDADDRRAVLSRDGALVDDVADVLRRETALPADDPRLAVIANLIVFINAFVPFRDWYMRDLDNDLVLQTIVTGLAAMARQLAEVPPSRGQRGAVSALTAPTRANLHIRRRTDRGRASRLYRRWQDDLTVLFGV